jgi:hypothetical protein
MASARSFVILCLLGASLAGAAKVEMNPIRKIVTLMQDMQKEIEAEGEKEKELYDKFMCFCETGEGELQAAIEGGNAKISELSAKHESETAEKSQIDQELADHKSDREQAKKDVEEATAIRNKENAEYEAVAADSATNIKALSGALPALEQGMGGAALLQTQGGNRLVKIVQNSQDVDSYDRDNVLAFLQGKSEGDYAPQSGQIVGIMKQMLESMQKASGEADADEAKAAAGFADLNGSKQKEIEVATGAIESKTVRTGELAVSIVQAQNALDDSEEEVADNTKFLATLKVQCVEKTKEWQERSALRAQEVAAISEAIAILNDDDALDVFKKTAASAFTQQSVGFLQSKHTKASRMVKAQTIFEMAAAKHHSTQLALISYSMRTQLKLASKAQEQTMNFNQILQMIDQMVGILDREQAEDDKSHSYCEAELEKSGDEKAAANDALAQTEATITELKDSSASLDSDIATLTEQIKDLDKSVAAATEQRKAEHAEYTNTATLNEAAMQLLAKAKNRLNKFYNPVLYKKEARKELSMEDSLYVKAGREEFVGLVQIRSHAQQPQAPATFDGPVAKKGEKSSGVIALMTQMEGELKSDMQAAENDEKSAQTEYEDLMADSSATRAQNAQSITDKEASRATLETKLAEAEESKALSTESLEDIGMTINHLHTQCDFLLQNYDARKEARSAESESLKNGKAVLSGADFGF